MALLSGVFSGLLFTGAPVLAQDVLPKPDAPFHVVIAVSRDQARPKWPKPATAHRMPATFQVPAGGANMLLNDNKMAAAEFIRFGDCVPSTDGKLDIGRASGWLVSRDHTAPNRYEGHVIQVTIDLV